MSGSRPLACDTRSTNLDDIIPRGVVEKMMVSSILATKTGNLTFSSSIINRRYRVTYIESWKAY